jgi:hypothetical protein
MARSRFRAVTKAKAREIWKGREMAHVFAGVTRAGAASRRPYGRKGAGNGHGDGSLKRPIGRMEAVNGLRLCLDSRPNSARKIPSRGETALPSLPDR